MDRIIESLSPIERKIVPYLNLSFSDIVSKSGLDEVSVVRALKFLENKGLVRMDNKKSKIVGLDVNGIYYKKNHLPERRLLIFLESNNYILIKEAEKKAGLSGNEFKVSLGVLKKKGMVDLKNGKIFIKSSKGELVKRFPEEVLIDSLPREVDSLSSDEKMAFDNLLKRKNIIELVEKKEFGFELTNAGKSIAGKELKLDLLEEVTPEVIQDYNRTKKFRRYDIEAKVPRIDGGKKHFVNQSIEYAKKVWTDMGFKEMEGTLAQTSFWNFDALFTAQDHPAREMQDTYFVKGFSGKLPDKEIVSGVRKAHESGVNGSKGWNYKWGEEEAKKVVLRTHTTCLSAKQLYGLKKKDFPAKFFAIGKNFRNETVDWSHGFEFNQTEGIVVDKDANFRHLLGYLKEFFGKMGFLNVKFTPGYFPYTEPSVEISAYHPGKKTWLELGGAGMFRPEVVVPLLGEYVPVLAWGPGFDRILIDYYKINDLRELYSNDIGELRDRKMWLK